MVPQAELLEDIVLQQPGAASALHHLRQASAGERFGARGSVDLLLLAQQFPWFGTLRLRGMAAEQDVKVALAELCAAQLEAVANVKRAYYDLYFNVRSERILLDNRRLAEDFLEITKSRYETTSVGLQNVLQAEVVLRDLDRELVRVRQGMTAARADLAQQLHVSPDSDLRTLSEVPIADA